MLHSLLPTLLLQAVNASQSVPTPLETVEVRATARQAEIGSIPGVSAITADDIDIEAATHANELLDRTPGTWISRGSGQESLVAIRSPVLTGPGACGAFAILEDRVPIRPAGFCNVNALFEVNLLQAQRVDVVRGPGNALYGANALHGVIDVSSGDPVTGGALGGGLMIGTDDYYRGRVTLSGEQAALLANYTNSRSFREEEGFEQTFINGTWRSNALGAEVRTQFSWAELDQETAGFILGENAYEDPLLRTQNLNPEAFRRLDAFRLTSRWTWQQRGGAEFELIPYLRSSDMDFLQHFLPGKPLERNGQQSAGMLFSWRPADRWTLGFDLEWAEGDLVEFQENPTEGSDFLVETRPRGFHYDYNVRSLMGAAWAQFTHEVSDALRLTAGLRIERLDYDYDNRMLDGNTRDDGTSCGFGGCLYTRPADRDDHFDNLAPDIGLNWRLSDSTTLFTRLARGFRPPQATELYRLQSGQRVADIDSEILDSLEIGLRGDSLTLDWQITVFAMRKDKVIFRDADGYNVSDGKTDHRGLEAAVDWQLAEPWRLSANAAWANHEYAFERPASGILEGNDVDTAPEWLAAARLAWAPSPAFGTELEWVHQGGYYLEPTNAYRYGGHELFNLRAVYRPADSRHLLAIRVTNLLDTDYAERADFAFGNFRYFPGAGRRFFVEWRYVP